MIWTSMSERIFSIESSSVRNTRPVLIILGARSPVTSFNDAGKRSLAEILKPVSCGSIAFSTSYAYSGRLPKSFLDAFPADFFSAINIFPAILALAGSVGLAILALETGVFLTGLTAFFLLGDMTWK